MKNASHATISFGWRASDTERKEADQENTAGEAGRGVVFIYPTLLTSIVGVLGLLHVFYYVAVHTFPLRREARAMCYCHQSWGHRAKKLMQVTTVHCPPREVLHWGENALKVHSGAVSAWRQELRTERRQDWFMYICVYLYLETVKPRHLERSSKFDRFRVLSPLPVMKRDKRTEREYMNDGVRAALYGQRRYVSMCVHVWVCLTVFVCECAPLIISEGLYVFVLICVFIYVCERETFWDISLKILILQVPVHLREGGMETLFLSFWSLGP